VPERRGAEGALFGVADGDGVAFRYSATGTNNGDFQGIPASGKSIDLTGHQMLRVSGGKIQEAWGYWDTLGLLQQLGIIPAFGGGPPEPAPSEAAGAR
jgi:hypothetical protein